MFAYFFLKLLRDNEEPYLVPSHIFEQVARLVSNNSSQQLRSQPLQNAGDEGGQFVFRLAGATGGTSSSARPSASESGGGSSDEMARLREEVEKLKAQASKPKAEESKPIEEARVRPPSAPGQTGRELTGKDGAPMVLVPAGEFLYGDNNQRMTLSAFYMDKYEVTTKLYAEFLQATSRKAPDYWDEISEISAGDLPVIGVDWDDADSYCRYYGKRLPAEQEWEKAARGTDGRNYPWGNEEPTSRHANFKKFSSFRQGYSTLASVESYESGKSPYGIYNMAGNVSEWTSSNYDSERKVARGGAWGHAGSVRTTDRDAGDPTLRYNSRGFRCAQDVSR